MTTWQKNYHPLYQEIKSQFDSHLIELISQKEAIIASSPLAHPHLKHKLNRVRRYKSGSKIRIIYVLSTERPELWESIPDNPEILFLYVELRSDETYDNALKYLRKHRLL